MTPSDIVAFLEKESPLFAGFSHDVLETLTAGSRLISFEASEAVIEFGSEARFLGVLLDGEAEVSTRDPQGETHVLDHRKPGDLFGEMALMTGGKAGADVIGLTRCTALLIPKNLFSTLIVSQPQAISFLARRLVELAQQAAPAGEAPPSDLALHQSADPYGFTLDTEALMRILVINCGSSSLKYNLYETSGKRRTVHGAIERIGKPDARHTYAGNEDSWERTAPIADHALAFAEMVHALTAPGTGILASPEEVSAIGHRVVHGGPHHNHAVLIDDGVLHDIEEAATLAPLHNPVNLLGIREAARLFPGAPQVAVFDTAFHQTMPAYAHLYGLPYAYYEDQHLRRYGFHGTSHKYVALRTAEFLRRPYNELETVVCHLGNGASVCAVDHGRSVDTSMGLTPAEGLVMGTRCGDLDPAMLVHIMRTENLDAEALDRLINRESGLLGISGLSNDMRELEAAAETSHHRALLAIKTFCYRVRKYIGAYYAAMGGLDAVAFTGGIGQGSAGVRALACQGLAPMGIRLDEDKNRAAGSAGAIHDISAEDSPVRILVVPTDEERMIARETLRALDRGYVAALLEKQRDRAVPIEISAHHCHLSQAHVEALFGPGHQLTPAAELSQPGQFACEERIGLLGPKGRVNNVRVLGPARKESQVEIAMTEQFKLGIQAPIRASGDLKDTPGLTLEGPAGAVQLERGVICALRHIHMTPEDALRMGLKDRDIVAVRVEGDRELLFGDVLVRVHPDYRLAMHLDTDEANAAHLHTGVIGHIDRIQSRP